MNLSARIHHSPSWQLVQSQWLNLTRMPSYSIPTLGFPLMFYAFFGLIMIPGQSLWLLCTFATFGILGTALFAFGVGVASERAEGWWLLLRCSPAPFCAVLIGKAFSAMLFAAVVTVSMAWLAALFGDVRLPTVGWAGLVLVMVLGTLPFCLLGLAFGLILSPQAAPAVINIVYLPLGFLSGLWIPVAQFPPALQALAEWLPPYHLAALALHVTGTLPGPWLFNVGVLLAYTVIFAAAAGFGWRRLQRASR
ncbi:MAG: ABC transporter permease [Wenzhouxiangella sp.]|nr:MAG: ABC transporter permease [Wenzhouxiangella sp.]